MHRKLQLALLAPFLLTVCFHPANFSRSSISTQPTPAATPTQSSVDAAFAAHVAELKKRLPSAGFTIVIQPPLVVVGDEPAAEVKAHSENTVKWAVEKLKQDYFEKDPKEILDVWLFKDAVSYKKNTLQLFGETPTTPYGYYSSAHKALIMNIGTGGGTLVHEIVHPFIEANFPACPAWFNEGLGSLYEQCGEVNGHIHGFTNWRLPGLQRAVKAGTVPTFQHLTSLETNGFYNDDRGTNYAQARYLCYYLQQQGLLTKFYRDFHDNQKSDPTGYKTLQKILNSPNMTTFQKDWSKYVLGLKQGYEMTVTP
jgi:hypothetical protein